MATSEQNALYVNVNSAAVNIGSVTDCLCVKLGRKWNEKYNMQVTFLARGGNAGKLPSTKKASLQIIFFLSECSLTQVTLSTVHKHTT